MEDAVWEDCKRLQNSTFEQFCKDGLKTALIEWLIDCGSECVDDPPMHCRRFIFKGTKKEAFLTNLQSMKREFKKHNSEELDVNVEMEADKEGRMLSFTINGMEFVRRAYEN